MTFEQYRFYAGEDLPAHSGEFATVGERGLLVARRDRVRFPDRSTCFWPRCSPRVADWRGPIDVFIERHGKYQFLGEASLVVYGQSRSASEPDARLHFRQGFSRERWLELQEPLPARSISRPEREIMELDAESTAQERISALRTFVDGWFGKREASWSPPPTLPAALAELHRLVHANPRIVVQNGLVPPEELVVTGERCVFYVENQAVCEWAYEDLGDDPTVWFRLNDHRNAWQRESEPLSGFVIQLVIFETIIAAPAGFGGSAASLDRDHADRLRARFVPLKLGSWLWGPTSFYGRDGALMLLMANGDDAYSAMVAAQEPDALTCIDDLIDESWENVAF